MTRPDMAAIGRRFRPSDMLTALALLTRLPLPYTHSAARAPSAAAWAYPLVGLVVGGIALCIGWVMQSLGTAAPVTAFFILLSMIVMTGAMHEDGLADCADGFWGGWTVSRRLEIMKDSQIGTYGVIALAMSLFLRWYILTLMIDKGALTGAVLVSAVMSRAAMVWIMHRLPNARKSGLSAQTGRPAGLTTVGALAIGGVTALAAPEVSFVWLVVFAGLATLTAGWIARSKIGGQTGDVIGATQQMVEITVLIAFDVMISNWDAA
ncbi:MAG: adenosylcobinamide-GDP ribazoletransferase [Sulfitobacter sp.]